MSDFVNEFWSWYVGGITIVSILGCAVLLYVSGTAKVNPCENNTTGHVWDEDLREMNNPLPKWWVYLFIITVVFGLAYAFLYPTLGSNPGKLGWTSRGQHEKEVEKMNASIAPIYEKFASMDTAALAADPQAQAIGERLFMNNCAQCHGSDARGNKGFPNLTDNDWLYGGAPENIKETLLNGRVGMMPPMAAAVGTADDVSNLSHYVLSLSGSPHDSIKAAQGKVKFAACAACHGNDGKGNQAVGAPNLTDNIWLHGWGVDAITQRIHEGKTNVMPAWKEKLTEPQIGVLTAYIWGMSNQPKN
jgi:cytochrome c oxidase cbb3-type subunit 3